MRPDRVMRTSVLSPMMNYAPTADVQAVAQAFTQGPPMAMSLEGLGLNPFQKIGLRIKAAWAARKARKFMFAGFGSSPGPAIPQASQIAPQMQSQMILLDQLMRFQNSSAIRGVIAQADDALRHRRPYSFYYAG
jgi:hypothetical protein